MPPETERAGDGCAQTRWCIPISPVCGRGRRASWGQPRKARRSREDVLAGLGADRQLIAIESESYRFQLVEHVRSQYWREDVYDKLEKVTTRP